MLLKERIAGLITGALVRQGDTTSDNTIEIPFVSITDIANETAEDILNFIEETQSRYYEEWEPE